MNFLEALRKMGLSVADLRRILVHVVDGHTEMSPVALELIAKLEGQVPAEKLVELATVLPAEILNAAQGKFDPRFHPGGAS